MSLVVPPAAPLDDDSLRQALTRLDAALMAYEQRRPSIPHRIWAGITTHFSRRATEWFGAAFLIQFGWILYFPPSAFETSPNLAVMATFMAEETWGIVCLAVGGVHLIALTVNGTFPAFRWSPHVRATASLLAFVVWLQITWLIYLSGVGGTGFGTYRLMFLLEVYNFVHAIRDTGKVDGRHASNAR